MSRITVLTWTDSKQVDNADLSKKIYGGGAWDGTWESEVYNDIYDI